jgi:hypothetical protein
LVGAEASYQLSTACSRLTAHNFCLCCSKDKLRAVSKIRTRENKKMKIKIIKKKALKNVNKPPLNDEESKLREERREMISTVSGWVDEFQRTRDGELKQGFEWPSPVPISPAQS